MMMAASQGSDSPQGGRERSRRDILRSTKRTWVPLDEQLPPGLAVPRLEDSKQESIQQWLDSGFFVSVNENFQQVIDHTAFSPGQGMVHMTVQDYMRSLHQFPETPTLSRGTSFNSCHSAASTPQSIPEWLEFWEKDPVEILLDLGFGSDEPDICTQIPARFLGCASAARGINIRVFLEAQRQRMDIENPNLYGRFRQLEILDHVANAFSSLLNEVNTLQSKAEDSDGEESVQRTSVGGAKEHQRVGELLRRASEQNTRGDYCSKVSASLKNREEFSILSAQPRACGAQLPAVTDSRDHSHLPPVAEHCSLQACDDLTPCHPPRALLKKWWPSTPTLARPAPPSCVSEGSVKDRTPTENWTNKLRGFSRVSQAPDSFEMEEVQSFEEESGDPPNLTSGTVGATVSRANSCQSDSSGFLEEPPEPPAWQMPALPAGQSPAEDGCREPGGQSPRFTSAQHCQQDSEESSSKSGASTSFSSQDWSVLEDKSPEPEVEKESELEDMGVQPGLVTSDVALSWAATGGDSPGKDSHQRQPLPVPQTQHEANIGRTPRQGDCPPEFLVTQGGDGFLRPEGAREAHVQSHPWESHTSPGMDGAPDKSLPAGSEAPRGAGSSNTCPDFSRCSQTRGSPPPPVPKPGTVRTSTVDLSHTSENAVPHLNKLSVGATPQAKPRCGALGHIPPLAEPELGALPSSADLNAASSESVTVQMSSSLVSAAHGAVAWGTHSRRTSSECTVGDPVTMIQPVLGTEARQFNDVSVQTCIWEPKSWCCCSVPSNRARPLTKSVSLDTGFPSSCPVCLCRATPAHCQGCCHHHSHGRSVGPSPGPASSGCRHGPHSHGHLEAQFTKTLEVLQDTVVRELCSCTANEMEAMKMLCQGFREHLEEMEQHLTGQQAFFSRHMSEEERKEAEHLQTLRRALRQQVEELQFQLGDRARQIREGVLLQLELLTGDPPGNRTNLHQYDWTADKKGQIPHAQAHPALSPGAAFPANDGQQASCPSVSHMDACPPLALERHTRMSPPAREELGAALSSQLPVGEKEIDICL